MITKRVAILAVMMCIQTAAPKYIFAQQDSADLARLKRQVEALTHEIEAMRLGDDVVVQADTSTFGLGPAASKVYRARPGVSIGGYGETLLQRNSKESTIDALRMILYAGYKFTPKILFNSEVEFEHASTEYGGSVSVEFAYIDYVALPQLGVRAGLVLVPMGLINELHEPPVFLGARRPLTETFILPSTWRENGLGIFGETRGFAYRAYVINGLDAVGGRFDETEGFSANEGLRGGRQSGSKALIEHPAVVARADYISSAIPGVTVGGSAYTGNSIQKKDVAKASTSILEGHAQYRAKGFDLRALYATANVGNAQNLNQIHGFTGAESVGKELHGWYAQAGYDLLHGARTQQLIPYIRYEAINTQAAVPTGFAAALKNDRTVTTIGAMWKPITNIGVKADYQINDNQADTGVNQFNVSLGYLF